MKGITYLFFTSLKNQIKELVRRPAKLIAVLFFVAMLILVIFSGNMARAETDIVPNLPQLRAIVLAVYTVVFLLSSYTGLSSGATFYTMADVGLLFSAPISPRKILTYGLIRQMGTSLLVGFFLLFQYSWLHQLYGLSIGGLVLILIGYALSMFGAQVASMVIYSLTAGDDRKRGIAKGIFYAIAVLSLALVGVPALTSGGDFLSAAVNAANSPLTLLIPVGGPLAAAFGMAFGGSTTWGIAGAVLGAVSLLALLLIVTRLNSDFYEDVLKATEVSFSAITAKKEGKMQEVLPQKVKVGKTGLGGGKGASSFFYKHRLENRRARIFLLDGLSLIMAVAALIFGYAMRHVDGGTLVAVFAFTTYLQLFTSSTGRWLKELLLPYIYMVPQPSFKKLLAICREQVVSVIVEALVVMIPVGLIIGATPLEILALIAGRIGFGLLYMAGNILAERLLGGIVSKILIMGLYFLTLLIVAAPGIALGIVCGIFLHSVTAGILLTLPWNLLAAALIGYFCRGILDYAELNNR